MKYNTYDSIDENDYEYCQSLAMAEDLAELCEADAYYQFLETDDIAY